MSDLSIYPQEDNFSTRLASAAASADVTIIVNTNVSFTFSDSFRIIVEPGTSNSEPMLVTAISGTTWTVTRAQKRYTGDAGSAISHPAGATVIISDNFGAWDDIKTATNSKADTASPSFTGEMVVPVFADATARDAAIAAPTNGAECYLTTEGKFTDYTGGVWTDRASGTTSNASETVAGKVELATNAEQGTGTSTGATGARLVSPNDQHVKTSSGAGDENKVPVLDATGKFASGFVEAPASALLTAKGSIYAATAASTVAELAVGTDSSSLIADANEPGGLRYAKTTAFFYTPTNFVRTSTGTNTLTEAGSILTLALGGTLNWAQDLTLQLPPRNGTAISLVENFNQFSAGDIIDFSFSVALAVVSTNDWVFGLYPGVSGSETPNTTNQKAIFKFTGGSVETSTADGTTEEDQTLSGVTLTVWNTYRIRVKFGTSVEFYVNDVLKTTHSTNIPLVSVSQNIFYSFGVKDLVTSAPSFKMASWFKITS